MNTNLMLLISGEPGTGKTVGAATFPKPMLLLDLDKGTNSIYHAKDSKGVPIVSGADQIEVVELTKPSYYDLNFQTLTEKGSSMPPHVANAGTIITQFNSIMRELDQSGTYKGKKYRTLVIDNLTTMFRVWKEMILLTNRIASLRIQDYGTLENILYGQFIPSLKTLNSRIPYIILIDHIQADKDETTGKVSEFPIGPSSNMGRALAKEFDESYISKYEGGKYIWRTRPTGLMNAKSRLHLPEVVEANWNSLKPILEKSSGIVK